MAEIKASTHEHIYHPRETLGDIMHKRDFQWGILNNICSAFVLAFICFGENWLEFHTFSKWATKALILGNFLAIVSSTTHLISWIAIDKNSWLLNTLILISTTVLLVSSSSNIIIKLLDTSFHPTFEYRMRSFFKKHSPPYNATRTLHHHWLPIVVSINFFQGILLFMNAIYLCIIHDR